MKRCAIVKRRALWKDFFVEIKTTLNRFLSILLIVALGVAFYAGIRATGPDMRLTADAYFDQSRLMDIRLLSTLGFSKENVEAIANVPGVKTAEPGFSTHVLCKRESNEIVVEVMSLTKELNLLNVTEGRLPQKKDEVLVDTYFMQSTNLKLGDIIQISSGTDQPVSETLNQEGFRIVGIGTTSYYLSYQRGSSNIGNGTVDSFLIVLPEAFSQKVYTTVYISVKGAAKLNAYSKAYEKLVDDVRKNIEKAAVLETARKDSKAGQNPMVKPVWYVLDRESIEAYVEYEQNAERIAEIGKVFPVIFFLVAALISLTSMTRLVEEERIQIGTLKALGYSKTLIAMKYILYGLMASLAGSILGALAGLKLLPTIIITAYKLMYTGIVNIITPFHAYYAVLAALFAVFTVSTATILACYRVLLSKPAQLMRPEPPKAGKRVFMERFELLWGKLNFTWKATIRNLLRYKKRFLMTILGVCGCMALLLVAFGLKDSILVVYQRQFTEIMKYDASISIDNNASEYQKEELEARLKTDSSIAAAAKVRVCSVDVFSKSRKISAVMYIPKKMEDFDEFIVLRSRTGQNTFHLNNEGVILTEQAAKLLGVTAGDSITIKGENREVLVKITAVTENYMSHCIYMSPKLYQSLFKKEAGYNEYLLLKNDNEVDTLAQTGSELLELPAVSGIFYVSYYESMLNHILKSLNTVVWVLILAAGALAFVVLYNLNSINISERRRELATIKVLGFSNREVAAYVFRENIILTILGILFGAAFGTILHRYVITTVEIDMVMFGRNINLQSYFYGILLTLLFSILVNLEMYYKVKKINMVESLKSVE